MTEEKFLSIMEDESIETDWRGCNATQGLLIMQKYLPEKGIAGAGHDAIWGSNIEDLIDAGITEEDVIKLRKLNWMVEDDTHMSCFV